MTPNRCLRQARELRGWSQAKVAEQIGTDATTVSRWERGLFSPTPYFRERLCAIFGKNAEELGLLEGAGQPQDCRRGESSMARPEAAGALQEEREDLCEVQIVPPIPPSWARHTDTFAYILHSAEHDRRAHMLWEDAYVRVLRGQHQEAQQLGEASLIAFECVGHVNARALREWLRLQGPVTPPSSTAGAPPMPLPAR
ncbi:MAG: helix-turn-helix domain-containing protein, partial [Ktedonobacteraceae bacterium]|nr:helix-turn-helix domain-containing protein [Ktedonobacteraceae bacterium]